MNLAIHAAGNGRVQVGDVAHAGYRAGMERQRIVAVEVGRLTSVLETCSLRQVLLKIVCVCVCVRVVILTLHGNFRSFEVRCLISAHSHWREG